MRVILDGTSVTLDDRDLIGEGGEARVYALGADQVVKVFHPGAPAALRALREQKLRAFPVGLPSSVVTPTALAVDDQGAVVGYRMRRVAGAVDIARLAKPAAHQAGSQNATLSLFRRLFEAMKGLHASGVVIGDFNDGNVLVDAHHAPFLIDADSMQLSGLPCPVAHERFLDPRLYGVSLVDGLVFSADSDGYALRVLLFQSLCCVHPYGGTHASLPTLLRRAEARHSVLRDDVALPRMALPARALPEALLQDLRACFDDDARVGFDARLLDAVFVRCGCGLEHARKRCPSCQVKVVVPATLVKGAVSFELVRRGLVVGAAASGGTVCFVVEQNGKLVRENGDVVLAGGIDGVPRGLSVGFHGRRTWLALGTELVCLDGGAVVDRTSTGPVFGAAAFSATPVGLFRLHGDAIVHHESGVVVGRAVVGRTWLFPADDGCLAVWRAGNIARALWCRPGEAPVDVALPPLSGRVVELHVVCDGDRAVVSAAVDVAPSGPGKTGQPARRLHRVTLLSRSAGVTAHLEGRPDEHAVLGNVRGKVLSGANLLSTSTAGLVLLDGDLHEQARFADTHGLVDDDADLLRGSGGDVVVVSDAAIHLLRRRAATGTSHRSTP